MQDFLDIEVERKTNTVSATGFLFMGQTYTIYTSDVRAFREEQERVDKAYGYSGVPGNYETVLFRGGERLYPLGSLPGHPGLGIFQRYLTEEEARDGHQQFVTTVKRALRRKAKS